ncbi:unnamed protein product [Acanthoscelides obtectus]|uniref:Chitin-binding type-2 domain-containing protein n=2 Tax=Acanthoscelides obtectus TaxID=200917 RepID=A0A9P0P0Q1_ACAOB|nr:unnamed protein product [Acanthoscelides obtectus]CAK1627892.1 hypothetical protein AOBTE_LOCUS4889 [Acanthoscelides obtectus]
MTCFYKLSFVSGVTLGQRKYSRNVETTVVKTGVNFDCPEEFGYYPHPNDCTQYYVCVFGGALLESCTGGLMYSHELQTCDWPRNVGCEGVELGAASSSASASSSSSAAPSAPSRGRERDRERDRDGVRERESQRENNRDDRRRFTPPPPPQPQAVVTSRGQPRQLHHSQQEIIKQQQQQQLYEDAEEVLPPAEEVENDRQQRVYRGQPSTVGQVQRDRDGLRNANVIPTYTGRGEKIGVISFGTQNNQHYSDESSVAPPKAVPTATPTSARTVYNNSQYTNNQHEPYYALYDDVDLYRDAEYSLNNYNQANTQRTQTPAYRGTPAPVAQTTAVREDTSKRGNTVYLQQNSYPQDTYQQSTVADYNDNRYDTQVTDDQAIYRQSNRQSPPSLRDDRNELNDVEDDIPKRTTNTRKPITTTIRTTTTTTTTPRTNPSKKSTQPLSSENLVTAKKQQFNKTISEDSRRNLDIPNPHNTSTDKQTEFRINVDDSVPDDSRQYLKPIPYPNPTPTTLKPMFHYITKAPKSTDHVSNHSVNSSDASVHKTRVITPTTYSPPKFFLKDILPKSLQNPSFGVDTKNSEDTAQTRAYKTLKAVRKLINPINVNHELANIARLASKFFSQNADSQTSQFNFENSASYVRPNDQRQTKEHLHSPEYTTKTSLTTKDDDYKPSSIENNTNLTSTESAGRSMNRGQQKYRYSGPTRLVIDISPEDEVATSKRQLVRSRTPASSTEDGTYEVSTNREQQSDEYSVAPPKLLIDMSTEEQKSYESSTNKYLYNNEVSSTSAPYEDDIKYPKRVKLVRTNKFTTDSSYENGDEISSKSKQLYNNRIFSTTTPKMIIDMSTEDDEDYILSSKERRPDTSESILDSSLENHQTEKTADIKISTVSPKTTHDHRTGQHGKLSTLLRTVIGASAEDSGERYKQFKNARFPHSEQTPHDTPAATEEVDDYTLSKPTVTQNHRKSLTGDVSDRYRFSKPILSNGKNNYRFTEKVKLPQRLSEKYISEEQSLPLQKEQDYDYKASSTEEQPQRNIVMTTPTPESDYDYRSSSTEHISLTEFDYDYKSSSTENLSDMPLSIMEMSTSTEDENDYKLYKEARLLQINKLTTASPTVTTINSKTSSTTQMTDVTTEISETNEVSNEYFSDRSDLSQELDNFVSDERNDTVKLVYDNPPPIFKPIKPIPVTSKSEIPQSTSPARVSRVNAAIKSLLAVGGRTKCPNDRNPKCNEVKSRTNNRGRGSAHYGGAGTQITNNEVTFNTNRGTPAPRSRPTLKPTTSIVSKSQEYVDIYRYPPRRPSPIYPQPQPDKTAAKCRKDVCLLPDCSCGGRDIPGDIPVEETPQMVLMTFDDAVNDLNKNYYIDLFENNRKNPNGCPIAATFYVSHEWTDYSQVQNLYADGHEMASHTVSHSFGEQFSQKKWTREVAGQREILSAYGGVKLEDVRGMRAPFLSVGGNKMFKMLYDSNFTYDSSMPIYENKPPSWPYTLDYKLFHDCMIPPCPTRSYPGVWEVPMVMWQDLNGGRCSMGDACSNPPDSEGVYKMLMKNFQRHYTTNRAPFGLFYHAAWFTQPHHKEGFINFIDSILTMKDVWLVTNWQAIQWVRDPTPISRMNNYEPFQCNYSDRPKRCNNPKVCNLWHKSGVRYMRTCQPCPDIYPWTGNTGIRSSKIDNDIED